MPRHKIAYIIAAQLLFAFVLSVVIGAAVRDSVPQNWNATAWSEFSEHISQEFAVSSAIHRVSLLLTLHMMHLYCYMPMLHVTKILYGYWLGLWGGWTLCVAVELVLLVGFLYTLQSDPRSAVQDYVSGARGKGRLFFHVSILCVSSLPLQTKTLLVKFSDVTRWEYMSSNLGPTLVLSMKNVACGALLAMAPTPNTVATIGLIVGISLVLPTVSTILVSSQTILLLLKNEEGTHSPPNKAFGSEALSGNTTDAKERGDALTPPLDGQPAALPN